MEISLLADYPGDTKLIAKWYFDHWGQVFPNLTLDRLLVGVEKSASRTELPISIVAHVDDELVGVVELKLRENVNYPEYEHWLGGVYVKEERRGNGISAKLVREAKRIFAEMGITKVYLQCDSDLVELYRKSGFSVLHEADHHGVNTIIMVSYINT